MSEQTENQKAREVLSTIIAQGGAIAKMDLIRLMIANRVLTLDEIPEDEWQEAVIAESLSRLRRSSM